MYVVESGLVLGFETCTWAVLLVAVGLRGHALAWHVANITCVVKHAWHVHRHANVGMWVQTVAGVGAWAC